jgi:hypothetical protein
MNIENEKHKLESKIKRFDEQIDFLQKLKARHLARIHANSAKMQICFYIALYSTPLSPFDVT